MDRLYIIDEIKRIAKSNNGVAPGKQKFYKETGIKESDWYGRFWTKWSDAVKEAGLHPNELQKAFTHDYLLEKLALLVEELGYFPTGGDLRLKAKADSGFPSHTTFRRLGNKQAMIRKLRDFCMEIDRYKNVVPICESLVTDDLVKEFEPIPSESVGYVYLIKFGQYYKIGRSNSVGRRQYELSLQLPEKVNVTHSIVTDDPVGIEAYWHKRFKDKRSNGEWFKLTQQDIKAFKKRKFM